MSSNQLYLKSKTSRQSFRTVLAFVWTLGCFSVCFFIPATTYVFPAIHNGLFYILFGKSDWKHLGENLWGWPRLVASFLESVLILPISWAAGTGGVMCMLVLFYVQHCAVKCQRIHKMYCSSEASQHIKANLYRQLQLIAVLTNSCFQQYFWPNCEYTGSACVILMLYLVIVLHGRIHSLCYLVLVLLWFTGQSFCFLILDFGSRPMLASKKYLNHAKKVDETSRWIRMFYASCVPITMKVGSFHNLDRVRCLDFVRFCFQRTFVLVLQTKAFRM